MPTVPAYSRSQAQWALWRLFTRSRGDVPGPTAKFAARISKLLELDRGRRGRNAPSPYAFVDFGAPGKGGQLHFTTENIFCMAIALDLMDLGFKQAEVVLLLKHTRAEFAAKMDEILELNVPFTRSELDAKRYRRLPVEPVMDGDELSLADPRCFAVFNKIEMTETLGQQNASEGAVIFRPRFARGLTDLMRTLRNLDHGGRKAIVLEIAGTARQLTQQILPKAPEFARGQRKH